MIDGLSSRTLAEISRLELSRNHLGPGEVGEALRSWKNHMRLPSGVRLHREEHGHVHWFCCGDPREARALLDVVTGAMSRRGARELRRVLAALDRDR
ncbi:hypothetical protein ABZ172_21935 [Streptomyces sp. NPDC006296]|uniref:hypothetical protein n=1 Tax=Streptomyces sp. NPDC006296 TaxID=3156746 RepID=UPI0033BE51ED